MSESAAAKAYWSTNHVQSARLMPRGADQDYRYALAEHVAALKPESVLEFGCSSGRNLAALRLLLPDTPLAGVDMNAAALRVGRSSHPSLALRDGDESSLAALADHSYDVVFTCSVLDHILEPEWRGVYAELVRVSGALVLLEPIVPSGDGWLEADFTDLGIEAVPFTYAHDYLGNDSALRLVRHMPVDGLERWRQFGQTYHLMERAAPAPAP